MLRQRKAHAIFTVISCINSLRKQYEFRELSSFRFTSVPHKIHVSIVQYSHINAVIVNNLEQSATIVSTTNNNLAHRTFAPIIMKVTNFAFAVIFAFAFINGFKDKFNFGGKKGLFAGFETPQPLL